MFRCKVGRIFEKKMKKDFRPLLLPSFLPFFLMNLSMVGHELHLAPTMAVDGIEIPYTVEVADINERMKSQRSTLPSFLQFLKLHSISSVEVLVGLKGATLSNGLECSLWSLLNMMTLEVSQPHLDDPLCGCPFQDCQKIITQHPPLPPPPPPPLLSPFGSDCELGNFY